MSESTENWEDNLWRLRFMFVMSSIEGRQKVVDGSIKEYQINPDDFDEDDYSVIIGKYSAYSADLHTMKQASRLPLDFFRDFGGISERQPDLTGEEEKP